jgi:MATE family multidrug resistance protein
MLCGSSRRLSRALLGLTWRVGSPIAARNWLEVGAFLVFAAMLARVGEAELAAHVIVIRIISVSFLPGYAVGEAVGVLVGQAVGARRPALARQAWLGGVRIAVVIMAALGVLFVVVPETLVGVFGADPAVTEVARGLLLVGAGFQLFDAVAMVGICAINGAGDTRFAMFASVVPSWLVKLPIGYALAVPMGMGAVGAWLGLTAEIAVVAGLALWRLAGARWLEQRSLFGEPAVSEAEQAEPRLASG